MPKIPPEANHPARAAVIGQSSARMKAIGEGVSWGVLGLGYTSIGWLTGFMIGASDTPVVGVIIPPLLGIFITAMNWEKIRSPHDQRWIPGLVAFLFCVGCYYGSLRGWDERRRSHDQGFALPELPPGSTTSPPPASGQGGPSASTTPGTDAGEADGRSAEQTPAERRVRDLLGRWKIYLLAHHAGMSNAEYLALLKLWGLYQESNSPHGADLENEIDDFLGKIADSGRLRDEKSVSRILGPGRHSDE